MFGIIDLLRVVNQTTPVTRDDLGNLGGDAHFRPPEPDRAQQIMQGQIPTAKHVMQYPWWFWL